MPGVPPSAPPALGAGEDHYDRISSSSEPPPYSAVLAKTPRLSLDTQVGCDWLTMWSRDDMFASDWSLIAGRAAAEAEPGEGEEEGQADEGRGRRPLLRRLLAQHRVSDILKNFRLETYFLIIIYFLIEFQRHSLQCCSQC